jgi:hypothetical protein
VMSESKNCAPGLDDENEHSIRSDPKLLADGWVRRHLADPERAKEAMDLYASMGFEVMAHELTPEDFGPNCSGCASVICKSYVLIYTRKPTSDNH